MAVQLRTSRSFDSASTPARYWLSRCEGFRVDGAAHGTVERILGDDPYAPEILVVRAGWRRRRAVPVDAVTTVVPAEQLLLVAAYRGRAARRRPEAEKRRDVRGPVLRAVRSAAGGVAARAPVAGRAAARVAARIALVLVAVLAVLAGLLVSAARSLARLVARAVPRAWSSACRFVADVRRRRAAEIASRPSRAAPAGSGRNGVMRPRSAVSGLAVHARRVARR